MDVRKGIFVLLVLSVTLVSGYSKYRVRPVSKSVYRNYVDKYRGYRNSYAGYYPNRRPGYRSLGQFIGRDFHLQRSLPRFKSGYQKGDQYLNRGVSFLRLRVLCVRGHYQAILISLHKDVEKYNFFEYQNFSLLYASLQPKKKNQIIILRKIF